MVASAAYADYFAEIAAGLPGNDIEWFRHRRARAIEAFAERGLPNTRIEEWKYTSLRPLEKTMFRLAPRSLNGVDLAALARLAPDPDPCRRLVFVNGGFRADLSALGAAAEGVTITTLGAALEEQPDLIEAHLGANHATAQNPVRALNAAFMTDGAVVHLARDTVLERPLHLVFVTLPQDAPAVTHAFNLIVAEPGARASIVETHTGVGAYWGTTAARVVVAQGAEISRTTVLAGAPEAFHLGATEAEVASGGGYQSFVLSHGGRLSRDEIDVSLDGEGAGCRLDGLALGRRKQHIDNTTRIVHRSLGAESREVYRGVIDDNARSVFQGKVTVEAGAHGTDAYQLSQNLLLSDTAEADAKPELMIYADDVKCSHGATVGALDDETLFYLRARGIGEAAARDLLVEAFAGEIIETIDGRAAGIVRGAVTAWLANAEAAA
jgi:Fe-S cluster assembly protein SufD